MDTSEKVQPFGNRSKQSLSNLCLGKTATLAEQRIDRYSRTLARLVCDGTGVQVERVRRGMVWVYRKYALIDSPLYAVENEAQAAKQGLWADADPIPP